MLPWNFLWMGYSRSAVSFFAGFRMVVTFPPLRAPMCSSQEGGTEPRSRTSCGSPRGVVFQELSSSLAADGAVNVNVPRLRGRGLNQERYIPMGNSVQSLWPPFAGLIGGTSVRLNAQTAQSNGTSVQAAHAGVLLVQDTRTSTIEMGLSR